MALWGIFDRDVAKRRYRHANVSESLLGHRLTSHTSTAPPPVGGGVRRAGFPTETSVPQPGMFVSIENVEMF